MQPMLEGKKSVHRKKEQSRGAPIREKEKILLKKDRNDYNVNSIQRSWIY